MFGNSQVETGGSSLGSTPVIRCRNIELVVCQALNLSNGKPETTGTSSSASSDHCVHVSAGLH